MVGLYAAKIRALKPVEPYHGYGIKYSDEVVIRKVGKTAGKGKKIGAVMLTKQDKNKNRVVRHVRVRRKISGTAERPRLNVYRSLNEIYAQIIDDEKGVTLVSVSTKEKELKSALEGKNKTEQARLVGETVAQRAKSKNINDVVFDRGGYLYTGRVQALAEGARSKGLNF